MKLYLLTEKQVRNAIISWSDCPMQDVIDRLTPIELPSDEDIEKEAFQVPFNNTNEFYDKSFIKGAKWLKQQILNQNNKTNNYEKSQINR